MIWLPGYQTSVIHYYTLLHRGPLFFCFRPVPLGDSVVLMFLEDIMIFICFVVSRLNITSSNISVMFASYQMVNFVTVYNSVGLIQSEVLYIDPTVEWTDSIPYTLTAVVFSTCITLIPFLLLCIYPPRVYR